jgi:hypothetical protein
MTHHLRSDGEKMGAIAPSCIDAWQQSQKRFLNQRRRLHRVILALASEVTARKPMQFRLNQWQKPVQCRAITITPIGQHPRYFACLHCNPS